MVVPLICFVKDAVLKVIGAFQTMIGALNSFLGGALGQLDNALKSAMSEMESRLDCNMKNPFNCKGLFPDTPNGPTNLPMPTRCWVGYQPALGDQSNLGCTASDTCDDDSGLKACAACTGGGYTEAYGCDSVTKLCRCNLAPQASDSCTSNADCALEVGCLFVNAYLEPTFGSIPCTSCMSQPVCLVRSGGKGTCVCQLQPATALQCGAGDVGQRVTADPTQVCLVSLGLSSASSATYSASFQALAIAPCSTLNGGQTYCLSVWIGAGTSTPLVVGLALLSGRRLLGDAAIVPTTNASEWHHEPCRSLVLADPKTLGPTDAHARTECERWRSVGVIAISTYSLTALHPTDFTGWQAMGEGLSRKNASRQVAQNLLSLGPFLLAQTHFVRPVASVLRHFVASINLTWPMVVNRTAGITIERLPDLATALLAGHRREMANFSGPRKPPVITNKTKTPVLTNKTRPQRPPGLTNSTNETKPSRHLLQDSWKDSVAAVTEFSIQVADGNVAWVPLDIASAWSQGPFQWPPVYDYWHEQHPCMAGEIVFNVTYLAFEATARYYAGDYTIPDKEPPSLSFEIPSSLQELQDLITVPTDRYASLQLAKDVKAAVSCDFLTAQHCSAFRRPLLEGALTVAGAFATLSFAARNLGVPLVDLVLLALYIPAVGVWVFGLSPMCAPLVPTCLLGELVKLVEMAMPPRIEWPPLLQQWPGCLDGASGPIYSSIRPRTKECFRSCEEAPFEFRTWQDSLAWMWLWLRLPTSWLDLIPSSLDSSLPDFLSPARLRYAMAAKALHPTWPEMAAAQNVCFALTSLNLIPALLCAVALLALAAAALALAAAALQLAFGVAMGLLIYTHTDL